MAAALEMLLRAVRRASQAGAETGNSGFQSSYLLPRPHTEMGLAT
jgi:hypothetical protein